MQIILLYDLYVLLVISICVSLIVIISNILYVNRQLPIFLLPIQLLRILLLVHLLNILLLVHLPRIILLVHLPRTILLLHTQDFTASTSTQYYNNFPGFLLLVHQLKILLLLHLPEILLLVQLPRVTKLSLTISSGRWLKHYYTYNIVGVSS